jgi:hypothetical protein
VASALAARATGRVTFDGIDILAATEDQMCALRATTSAWCSRNR